MKYVLTGAAGRITKPLAKQLLAAGHSVTVIGRNEQNLKPLVREGARAAIGSVEDASFSEQAPGNGRLLEKPSWTIRKNQAGRFRQTICSCFQPATKSEYAINPFL